MVFADVLSRAFRVGSLIAVLAAGPAAAQDKQPTFGDAARIASVGGSVTEIVYALGQEDKLVARDSTSLYPAQATKLPDVGYMRQLSPEGVLSVNPSGLLVIEGSGPKATIDVLTKASVPVIMVPETYDHAGILNKIRVVGQALGADEKAAKLSARVDADLAAAEKLTSGIRERLRVLFVLSMQGGKILAAGSNTAAAGIIELAGGANAVEGFSGYKQLSDEAAILAKPDVILMMDRGGDFEIADDDLFTHPAIAPTPAGQARRVVRMEGNYLLGFGPRTASAIRDLATALYGDEIRG
jgi:iron complex transport system substrate-binding protein